MSPREELEDEAARAGQRVNGDKEGRTYVRTHSHRVSVLACLFPC